MIIVGSTSTNRMDSAPPVHATQPALLLRKPLSQTAHRGPVWPLAQNAEVSTPPRQLEPNKQYSMMTEAFPTRHRPAVTLRVASVDASTQSAPRGHTWHVESSRSFH